MAITRGYLTKRMYQCEETNFHIYRLKQPSRSIKAMYKGINPPEPREDITYIMEGDWVKHQGYGVQFRIRTWRTEEDYQEIRKISLQRISDMLYQPPHKRI